MPEPTMVKVYPRPAVSSPPYPSVPKPQRFQLENGLRVVAIPGSRLPQVAARLVLRAGSVADPADWPGTAALTAALLAEGTQRLSGIEVNERIDRLGASLSARAGHDFTEVDFGSLAETLDEGLELFAHVLTDPVFPDREVERIRAETLDAFAARLDEPANVADDRTALAVFGDRHPYGRLPMGSPDGVKRLRREELVEFHKAHYRPGDSILVIAGDFSLDALRVSLNKAFAGWTGAAEPIPHPAAPTAPHEAGATIRIDWEQGEQGEIRVAGLGIPRTSADWVPAAVANYLLGGSTITGRLGSNLREDKGWTYGVRSSFAAAMQPGGWSVETAVEAGVTEQALEEIEKEISMMISQPVGEEELARAQEALVLSLPRAFETPARAVARFATVEAFSLDRDYWERFPGRVAAVTRDEVRQMAERHFSPARLVRVAVRPA